MYTASGADPYGYKPAVLGHERIRRFMGTSTFSEYTVMPEIALAKVDPDAPLDRACLFACGLSTGLGAAINTAKVEPGSTCAVFGAGMVGLGAVAGCRLLGAERISAVDLSEDRLELARGQGATDTLIGGPDAVEQILELTRRLRRRLHLRGHGERPGNAARGRGRPHGLGQCTVAGVAGKGETLDIVPRFLITGRRVAGSSFGGVKGATRCRSSCVCTWRGRSRWIRSSPTTCGSTRSTGASS